MKLLWTTRRGHLLATSLSQCVSIKGGALYSSLLIVLLKHILVKFLSGQRKSGILNICVRREPSRYHLLYSQIIGKAMGVVKNSLWQPVENLEEVSLADKEAIEGADQDQDAAAETDQEEGENVEEAEGEMNNDDEDQEETVDGF